MRKKPIAETAEIVRLNLDFEREERRLAREAEKALQDAQFAEAQKAREEAQRAREGYIDDVVTSVRLNVSFK